MTTSTNYADFYTRSIEDREGFWGEEAKSIEWHTPPQQVCDYSNPPFARWFVGGTTNLCHNAVDRHLKDRADQPAIIAISTETNTEKAYSFAELHVEVQRMAASLKELGVEKGDRVLIYMPMIAEAAFAMLACVRIGAIHSVVFGGFASGALASRIEDSSPKVIVSSDGGVRGGKAIPYKPLLDEAINLSSHKPEAVLLANRGLAAMNLVAGRDHLWNDLREKHLNAVVPCEWVDSTHPSYTLYTSGTTGKPKGVQRDTGGYAVALAASMKHIYCGNPGETYFSTSDIGWVVGHSYIIYGPLIGGMATIMYEGLPTRPDGGIWWSLVEKYKVTVMFSAPTAVRVLKKQDPALMAKYDLSSLRALFLAGEPLDEPTAQWISGSLKKPIIDNYWQTETGWPILGIANGVEQKTSKFGSPGIPMYGYNVKLMDDAGEELHGGDQKGVVMVEGPLPPGCMQTIWRDDDRFVKTYWQKLNGKYIYSTFDWGVRDKDGYFFILGRTDDVINVAGHRLGTREIEEAISSHPNISEVAVVGVADDLKGQVAVAFAVVKDASVLVDDIAHAKLEAEVMKVVDNSIGAVGRPARVRFVNVLPKTRSGKLLRRAIQAVCEGRDTGDLTTMDDPAALQQIRDSMA
ncbi:MAG: hypothetical protein RIR79_474 [Pseudomonadota bacterium]|jgi:propionyl-CoA synthetase